MLKKTILAVAASAGLAFAVGGFSVSAEAQGPCGNFPCHGHAWHGGGGGPYHHGFGGHSWGGPGYGWGGPGFGWGGGFPGYGWGGGFPSVWVGPPDDEIECYWHKTWRHHHPIRVRVCHANY
jgi:hypothetical protein